MDDDLLLFRLFAGDILPPVKLCLLESELVRALGASTNVVWLSREDMQKIRYKHNLSARQLPMISLTLRFGWAGIEHHRPNSMLFVYEDRNVFGKHFKGIVKVTGEKHELFLETFHRCQRNHLNSVMRRCTEHRLHHE